MKGKTKGKKSENIQAAGLRFEPIRHNKAALKQLSVRHHLKDLAAGGRHPLQWQRHFCGFLIWLSQRNHQLLLTTLTTSAIAPLPRKHLATDSAPTPTHKPAGSRRTQDLLRVSQSRSRPIKTPDFFVFFPFLNVLRELHPGLGKPGTHATS